MNVRQAPRSERASPSQTAADAARALERDWPGRPGRFDASRYFRGAVDLGFYNVGTPTVRAMAQGDLSQRTGTTWTVDDALTFADALIADRYLEVKGRRDRGAGLLPARLSRRAAAGLEALAGRRLLEQLGDDRQHLRIAHRSAARAASVARASVSPDGRAIRNLWVRRASAVSLIPSVRRGVALDLAYRVARQLHADKEDLIQKAVGWMLREAGKADPKRLERYLRANGPQIPRTTLRYAIERFPPAKRRQLLA